MKWKSVLYIILVGLIITMTGAVMVAYYDNQVNLLNQKIQANYRDHANVQDNLLLMADRDHFGSAEGESIALMVLGLFIAGIAPLSYVTGKWRSGELSLVLKQASAAMSMGILLLIIGTLTGASASIRLSEVAKEIAIINARGEISIQDIDNWVTLYQLYSERDIISGRLPFFWGFVLIGLVVAFLSGYAARRELGLLAQKGPPGET